ncbi:MAG TPA: hypothetical protein VMY78_09885 [Solirubrobacteraceae bacterium]|nr:hypothetical protein [Solirubrobacteraceae bacterium]
MSLPGYTESELQGLAAAQDLARDGRDAAKALLELVRRHNQPATLETYVLTQTVPVRRDEGRVECLSIGIVNPSAFALRLGLGGGAATSSGRGFPVPPSGAIVLPVAAEDFEIGLDDPAAVGGLAVVVYVLRFPTVQAFHLHRYG